MCNGDKCSCLTSPDGLTGICTDVPAVSCHQEEADTRIFLHAHHAANNDSATVVIRSPDTDVAVIGCAMAGEIPAQLIWQTGTRHRRRFVNLTNIARSLGCETCKALPGMHAFTGCDSTSAFAGRGTKVAFDLITGAEQRRAMQLLGAEFTVSDELLSLCETFVCRMYSHSYYQRE